jgi:hypothetical protein
MKSIVRSSFSMKQRIIGLFSSNVFFLLWHGCQFSWF